MTSERPWYRSLSLPSQILLVVCLALCMILGYQLFRQLNGYMAGQARLEETRAGLAALQERRSQLLESVHNIEREQEERVRERYGALPGETVWQASPDVWEAAAAVPQEERSGRAVWELWLDLFFGEE
jgi:cell division protein FtsB